MSESEEGSSTGKTPTPEEDESLEVPDVAEDVK